METRTVNRVVRPAIAGLAGSLAMHLFRVGWEKLTRQRDADGIFGFDREADVNSARLISTLITGRQLDPSSAARLGMALHYAYGPALGFACTMLKLETWSPLQLGPTLWIVADEIPITVTHVSNPFRKSIASHAGALLAHCLFAAILAGMSKHFHGRAENS